MEMALIYNRPSFVELLIENKLVLDDFLTPKRLFYLYNCIEVGLDFKFIHPNLIPNRN